MRCSPFWRLRRPNRLRRHEVHLARLKANRVSGYADTPIPRLQQRIHSCTGKTDADGACRANHPVIVPGYVGGCTIREKSEPFTELSLITCCRDLLIQPG